MRELLKRKSVIAFLFVCLAAVFGPLLLPGDPSRVVGAPFARPVWWNMQLPGNEEFYCDERGLHSTGTNCRRLSSPFQALSGLTLRRP